MDITFNINALDTPTVKAFMPSDAYVQLVHAVNSKGKNKLIAELYLPRGRWVVTAKAALHSGDETSGPLDVECRLVAGSAVDRAKNSVYFYEAGGFAGQVHTHYETTTLLLGVDLKDSGVVQLFADSDYTVKFTDIVISAIRVKSLVIERSFPP